MDSTDRTLKFVSLLFGLLCVIYLLFAFALPVGIAFDNLSPTRVTVAIGVLLALGLLHGALAIHIRQRKLYAVQGCLILSVLYTGFFFWSALTKSSLLMGGLGALMAIAAINLNALKKHR